VNKPKIMTLDIETTPGTGYVWNLYDSFMPLERMITPGGPVCASWKWLGEKEMHFAAEWLDKDWLSIMHEAMSKADAIVTYNGDKFDLQKLEGVFILNGLKPLPPLTSIDLYKKVKTLGYISGKLEYVSVALKIGKKVKHEGFGLWKAVMSGDVKAELRMEKYNKQDVRLTERLYKILRPYMRNHPHVHGKGESCPNCGSESVQHRGYRYTRTFKIERVACNDCGAWHSGKRSKIK
jgi:hypothetical protein